MRKFAILILVALGVAALACGHSNLPSTIRTNTNGNWEAQLIGGKGQAALLNFVTQFNVLNTNGGATEALTITGFSFFNTQSCFLASSASGSANLTTTTINQVTGSMNFTIVSSLPSGNTLSLFTNLSDGTPVGTVNGTANNGTLTNGVVTGDWTLTATDTSSDCTGSGTFIMCQNAATCTVP